MIAWRVPVSRGTSLHTAGLGQDGLEPGLFRQQGVKAGPVGPKYDVIVSYGPYTTSLAGLMLSRLTGAKLVIDMPGHPFESYSYYPGVLPRIKKHVSRVLVPALLKRADMVKLLYPTSSTISADIRSPGRRVPRLRCRLDDEAPVGTAARAVRGRGRYVLFLGFPWHLKGVDILIKAFHKVADKHPDVTLRVVGHCPDRGPFERLAAGHPRISLEKAVMPDDAIALMSRCEIFVLPSRTEAMGRVLLEAMAARKPIIASRVGGIPTYVEDGRNGLLFNSENVQELAAGMDLLLQDSDYADKLAARATGGCFKSGARRIMSEVCRYGR